MEEKKGGNKCECGVDENLWKGRGEGSEGQISVL